jgi:hypothetical protein
MLTMPCRKRARRKGEWSLFAKLFPIKVSLWNEGKRRSSKSMWGFFAIRVVAIAI